MTASRRTGVPQPPHPHERREPLPWHRPKPAEEDPSAPQSVQAILASPTYLLAEHDPDFITRPESREPRLQIEYLKADTVLTDEQIDQTAALLLSLDCNPHKCPSTPKRDLQIRSIYFSSISGPTSRPNEVGVVVRIVSYSVTTTKPGTGSSITSTMVSSIGTSTTCLGVFLGAFLAGVFGDRSLLAMGVAAPLPAGRTLDRAFFGVVRFAAFLRAGLTLALPRFKLFLRVAARIFALAMAVPPKCAAGKLISKEYYLSVVRHATFIR